MKLRSWYAVHGASDVSLSPSAMLACIRPRIVGFAHDFGPVDDPWSEGRFWLSDKKAPVIQVRRARPGEQGFDSYERWEQSLSAMLDEPHRELVLTHLHRTRQIVYLSPVGFELGVSRLARVCEQLCGYLARETKGLIRVFQEGFFSPDGESLLPYSPRHKLKTK